MQRPEKRRPVRLAYFYQGGVVAEVQIWASPIMLDVSHYLNQPENIRLLLRNSFTNPLYSL